MKYEHRIKSLQNQITKIRKEYGDLSKNPRTFSYMVAFGNPGGCISKSLKNRVDRWHEKLSRLHKKEGQLLTHIMILEGSPLTSRNKRDYLYYTNWLYSSPFTEEETNRRFERALQDAPKYVQVAYKDNYGEKS